MWDTIPFDVYSTESNKLKSVEYRRGTHSDSPEKKKFTTWWDRFMYRLLFQALSAEDLHLLSKMAEKDMDFDIVWNITKQAPDWLSPLDTVFDWDNHCAVGFLLQHSTPHPGFFGQVLAQPNKDGYEFCNREWESVAQQLFYWNPLPPCPTFYARYGEEKEAEDKINVLLKAATFPYTRDEFHACFLPYMFPTVIVDLA